MANQGVLGAFSGSGPSRLQSQSPTQSPTQSPSRSQSQWGGGSQPSATPSNSGGSTYSRDMNLGISGGGGNSRSRTQASSSGAARSQIGSRPLAAMNPTGAPPMSQPPARRMEQPERAKGQRPQPGQFHNTRLPVQAAMGRGGDGLGGGGFRYNSPQQSEFTMGGGGSRADLGQPGIQGGGGGSRSDLGQLGIQGGGGGAPSYDRMLNFGIDEARDPRMRRPINASGFNEQDAGQFYNPTPYAGGF